MTPQEVGDEMSKGLHMMKHFEKEMNHHPFGHKLIAIGKPMMLGGLHNAIRMMEPEVMYHMCHHRGHHHCKSLVNNIVKGIILFLIWKIFEGIDNRCCGMCESECIRIFKNNLNECYGKIRKVNSLLNESYVCLSKESRIAMTIEGLESINKMLSESDNQKETKDDSKKSKIKKCIKAVASAGIFGFSAKTIYNMFTRINVNAYGIWKDSYAEDVEKLYNQAIGKTPGELMFNINVFFNKIWSKIYHRLALKDTFNFEINFKITNPFKTICYKLEDFIFSKLNHSNNGRMPYEVLNGLSKSLSFIIISAILIALIIGIYYLIKFIYKKIKNRRMKIKEGNQDK